MRARVSVRVMVRFRYHESPRRWLDHVDRARSVSGASLFRRRVLLGPKSLLTCLHAVHISVRVTVRVR